MLIIYISTTVLPYFYPALAKCLERKWCRTQLKKLLVGTSEFVRDHFSKRRVFK